MWFIEICKLWLIEGITTYDGHYVLRNNAPPPPSLPSLFHLFLAVSILPDWTLAPEILPLFFFTDLSLVSISLSLTPIPTSISPLFHLYLVGLLSPLLPTLPWFIISNNTHNINITYTPTPCRNCGAVTDYIYYTLACSI